MRRTAAWPPRDSLRLGTAPPPRSEARDWTGNCLRSATRSEHDETALRPVEAPDVRRSGERCHTHSLVSGLWRERQGVSVDAGLAG